MASSASPFQLKTFAIQPIVLPRRPHTSEGQQQSIAHPHQSSQPTGRSAAIFKSPRLSLHKKESHGRNGTLVFSPSQAFGPQPQYKNTAAHYALEPVDFDPFEHSESFKVLIQNPDVSAAQRRDLTNLRAFRLWLDDHFPKVVNTMRSLRLLQARSTPSHEHHHHQHHENEVQDEHVDSEDPSDSDPDDDDYDGQDQINEAPRSPARLTMRATSLEAWQTLFRHATLQVFAPDDHLVVQDAMRSGNVFFVLNGSCELRFQPKFLEFLIARRKTTIASTKQQQPPCEERPASPPKSPGSLKQKHRQHSKKNKTSKACPPGTGTNSPNLHAPGLRRLSLNHLTDQDAHEVFDRGVHLKTLRSGGFFGLDEALFDFPSHIVSAISHGALQRSDIGLTTRTCMHVLRLPFAIFQQIRAIVASRTPHSVPRHSLHHHHSSSLFFPYAFSQERVDFLRQTFVFQSMRESTLQFLASHMRCLRIPRHEYLFTPGQQVGGVFLVKSGQLKVSKPYHVRSVSTSSSRDEDVELRDDLGHGYSHQLEPRSNRSKVTVETRNVELEILQAHDAIGLLEVCLMRQQFASHCIAMSDNVELVALSSFALFAALACEPSASGHVVENLTRHHAWHKVREYAALNHHSSEKEAKLSLAVQQRGPIQCSRCGWAGHVSTSSICVRAESPKAMLTRHASTITSSTGGAGTHKVVTAGTASPVVQLPLATRSSRTQQRLSSLIMTAKLASEDGELVLKTGDTITTTRSSLKAEPPATDDSLTPASPPQSVSKAPPKSPHTHSNAIVHADSQLKASLLRGLLPFLCMKQTGDDDGFTSTGCEDDTKSNRTELERALKRLDDALVDEAKQPNDVTSLVRPHTEGGGTRRRAGREGGAGGDRGSNLNAAAVQAVGRMSTVAAATMEEMNALKEWPSSLSSPRSPRSSNHSHRSSSLKKPDPHSNQRAQRRNAANLLATDESRQMELCAEVRGCQSVHFRSASRTMRDG